METLQIPKGKIIDLEKSDLSKNLIVLKDAQKKLVVDSWKELRGVKGYFIDAYSVISANSAFEAVKCIKSNKNIYPTLKHVKRALAEAQLLQIRERALEEYGGWEPDWENGNQYKYCVIRFQNSITTEVRRFTFEILSFPTSEMAEEFMEKHENLLMDWGMIEGK